MINYKGKGFVGLTTAAVRLCVSSPVSLSGPAIGQRCRWCDVRGGTRHESAHPHPLQCGWTPGWAAGTGALPAYSQHPEPGGGCRCGWHHDAPPPESAR